MLIIRLYTHIAKPSIAEMSFLSNTVSHSIMGDTAANEVEDQHGLGLCYPEYAAFIGYTPVISHRTKINVAKQEVALKRHYSIFKKKHICTWNQYLSKCFLFFMNIPAASSL